MPRESKFQAHLIDRLHRLFQGCVVIKNDPTYTQGFPDLLILFRDRWGVLEVKRSLHEDYQPNQEYYLELLGQMSFGAMICPENEEEVLHELQFALAPRRAARLSQRLEVSLG